MVKENCFVIMPFKDPLNSYYNEVIKPAVIETGLNCIRGDEIYSTRSIINDIVDQIEASKLLVADLTGKNPNVNYELGIAHALSKPVVIICQSMDDVPFDLKHLRIIVYDTAEVNCFEKLKQNLISTINAVVKNPKISTALKLSNATKVIPEDIKDLMLDSFKKFEGRYKSDETIEVDKNGNCTITKTRFQISETDISHIMLESYTDEPGKIKIVEAYDEDSKKKIGVHTYREYENGLSYFLVFKDLKHKSSTFSYTYKMYAENYLSNLINSGVGYRKLSPFQKMRMEQLSELYIFPNIPLFENMTIEISQHPNEDLLRRRFNPFVLNEKQIHYKIEHGKLPLTSGEIEVMFKLNN